MKGNTSKSLIPLTQTQLGIYIESLRQPERLIYHVPFLFKIEGEVSAEALAEALREVIKAHPGMSARIVTDEDGTPCLTAGKTPEVEIIKITEKELIENADSIMQPFDLDGGSLSVIKVYNTDGGTYFFTDFHHSIFDGSSHKVMLSDLEAALEGMRIAPESVTMFDIAEAEMQARSGEAFAKAREQYTSLLEGADTSADMLTDRNGKDADFTRMPVVLGPIEESFSKFCKDARMPASVVATTAMGLVLQEYYRRDDVTFATIWHGRHGHDYGRTFNMMVKTIPARVRMNGDSTVGDVLADVKKNLKIARDNDLYSFAEAANEFGVNSNFLFAYQGAFLELPKVGGSAMTKIPLASEVTGANITAELSIDGENLILNLEYRTDLYSEYMMRGLASSYSAILNGIITGGLDQPAATLPLVPSELLPELLRNGNGPLTEASPEDTIPGLFRKAAASYPEQTAVTCKEEKLTYSQLDEITDRLAYLLRNKYGVRSETVVGVMIERSVLMAIYPLAIMKAGGCYMPLDPHFPEERLTFMIEDAGADIILCDTGIIKDILPTYKGAVIEASILENLPEVRIAPEEGATPASSMVVLYTSGSTGKPKGVVLTQRNLVNYCSAYRGLTRLTSKDKTGAYAAFGFDAHMMDLYPTLSVGATVHIFDSEIRMDLTAMHDYIEREGLTVIFMTTQIAWQMATLFEFTTLRVLSGGGEKLPPLGALPYQFINLYGPTECSVAATAYRLGPEGTDGKDIGRPNAGYDIRIVDSHKRNVAAGAPGELMILGEGVARGYLNRPGLTAEKFIEAEGQRAYLTGDHVRYMENGDVEFVGRIDGLVKLRGLRIELGEIEAAATTHPELKSFAAAVKQIGGAENLVGYYIAAEGCEPDPEDIRSHMRKTLTEFMVPEIMVALDTMPLTPNGKVDRKRLPAPESGVTGIEITAPATEAEKELWDIAAEVLGHKDFGVTTNLLSAGLTSLMSMRLVASIVNKTGKKIPAKTVMGNPTVRELVAYLTDKTEESSAPKERKAKRKYYPLTENQRGVYIDWETNRDAIQYNIPQVFLMGEGTDAERLREAVIKTVEAHPGLKTRLAFRNGDIVQERRDDDPVNVTITDLDKAPDASFFQSRIRPFDLTGEQLFRCEIYRYGNRVYMLRDTHHIIFDGVSAMVFAQELQRAYKGENLQGEELSALEHSLDEKELTESEEFGKAEEWFDKLVGDSESTSYPRSGRPDSDIAGALGRVRMRIPAEEIRKASAAWGVTQSNYLMSSFLQLLHRLTREKTVQITTVNNGRNDMRLLGSTGMFVKTLPVVSRCDNPKGVTPESFAREIQNQFLTSQDYDFYPFTALVEKKGVRPEIMFVYEGGIDTGVGEGNGEWSPEEIPVSLDTAKLPLTMLVFDAPGDQLELVAEYDTSCYNRYDMSVLVTMFANLTRSLATARELTDGIMTDGAQRKQLESIRYGKRCEIPYRTMYGEMERRCDEHPDNPALVACDKKMTYSQFDKECNRIANALIKRGVSRGDRVVILLPRQSSLITSIYGTMKTGAAYIPCDPDYPAERIRLITEDSGARYIITTSERVGLYENAIDIKELLEETDDRRPGVKSEPEDVAYMIYTSGSTGRPKGVMIPQRAIANYLYGYWDMYYKDRPEIKTEMLLVTISFDASLNNLGESLTSGHCLVLANEDECKDVILLSRLMLENCVDTTDVTPSRLEAMLDLPEFREAISRVKHLNIGGEGFRNDLVVKLFDAGFHGVAINEYGPTETTVGSNQAQLAPDMPITAGKPFYNDWQRIVDAWGGELPVGAVGELYIFGRGVGLGYNNLPEKTAEVYVDYDGERGYRTGDLARWTAEGDVVILGRIDHQVKLRGLRIELGEIESVAMQFIGIDKVAADVREVNNIQHLCLYYTHRVPVDTKALKEFLASRLTEYMVPDTYTEIDEMPLTPNGKTNRKALPAPEIEPLVEYVEPVGELEKTIAEAFVKVLNNQNVGALDDFFTIGGTSINAIKVVAALSLAGHTITYKNVFTARTPRALAALIEGRDADVGSVQPFETTLTRPAESSKSEYADLLERNTLDNFLTGARQNIGDVLLTGATGFMGIHFLREIIENTDSNVTCLVRAKGGLSGESRLRTLLFYYFDTTYQEAFEDGRIKVIETDVTTPLEEAIQSGLQFDTAINCAANVKHFSAGNDIELVNVESVRNLIDLCKEKDARLVHISTVSIAGESVNGYPDPESVLTEQMLDFGQSLANQYVHSKYEAERLIMEAIRDRDLSAKIMRVGNLSARSSDGEFQANFRSNAFMGRLRAYVALGCAPYPDLDAPCEFSPIDEVCHAIRLLSTTPREMSVFHPCNNHRLPLGDVFRILDATGLPIEPVEYGEFIRREREVMDDPVKVNALQPLLAYDSDNSTQSAFIRYDSTFTNQILYRLGFRWNYTSHDYVARFIKAISALDFFSL
ncbi:MAG: amino acid adenylation domain-containing protein [Muribaculaceae bacterium]|nr:amino acid adenylation domain-containing protein [Muribaculaceae bacterium]